jgi:hypothetical protein
VVAVKPVRVIEVVVPVVAVVEPYTVEPVLFVIKIKLVAEALARLRVSVVIASVLDDV